MGLVSSILYGFRTLSQNGFKFPTYNNIDVQGAATVADDKTNQRLTLTVGGASTTPTFGNTTFTGTLTQGPWNQYVVKDVTVAGGGTINLLLIPFPTDSVANNKLMISASDGTVGYVYETGVGSGSSTFGGMFSAAQVTSVANTASNLSPTIGGSWSLGVLTISFTGPHALITAAADNGGGKVRLTLSTSELAGNQTGPLTNWAGTISVTISGLTVCTEANGTHAATFHDATHLDLLAVSLVHAGADSGTAVMTTPQTFTISAWGVTVMVP
jgi:hypothetical protein